MFQLAEKGSSKPMEVEQVSEERTAGADAQSSENGRKLDEVVPSGGMTSGNHSDEIRKKRAARRAVRRGSTAADSAKSLSNEVAAIDETSVAPPQLNLRQKLALVRRRLGYIQKRGLNEVHSYRYVTAADIAGAVGDILAELGVVVLPRLQSISHEPARPGRSDSEHLTRVVMSYTFADVDTDEEITVKVAGEGLDAGDKAPYKAMTGALKYALLQSFLLATGDDPENEHADARAATSAERVITPEQAGELQRLVEETGTELERVLTYYKVSALSELTETSYRRALDLLNRKLAKMNPENGAYA